MSCIFCNDILTGKYTDVLSIKNASYKKTLEQLLYYSKNNCIAICIVDNDIIVYTTNVTCKFDDIKLILGLFYTNRCIKCYKIIESGKYSVTINENFITVYSRFMDVIKNQSNNCISIDSLYDSSVVTTRVSYIHCSYNIVLNYFI